MKPKQMNQQQLYRFRELLVDTGTHTYCRGCRAFRRIEGGGKLTIHGFFCNDCHKPAGKGGLTL